MINEKDGRAKSVRTPEEDLKFLQDAIAKLSPDERTALDIMMAEMSEQDGESPLFEAFGDVEYKHRPVDIETFVKDDYFLGKTCDNLRPKLLEDLKELFESGYYNEIIYTGCVDLEAIIQGADGSLKTLREWLGKSREVIGFTPEGPAAAKTGVAKHSGLQKVVVVKLFSGVELNLTPDHKVMAWRDGYEWIPAGELRRTDYVVFPRSIATKPTSNLPREEASVKAIGDCYPKDCQIPDEVCRASNKSVAAFLNTMWSINGEVLAPGDHESLPNLKLVSKSKKLIYQVHALLLRFEIVSEIRHNMGRNILIIDRPLPVLRFLSCIGPLVGKELECVKLDEYFRRNINNGNLIDAIPISRYWLFDAMVKRGIECLPDSKWAKIKDFGDRILSRDFFEEWCVDYADTDLAKELAITFPPGHGFTKVLSVIPLAKPIEVGDVCDVESIHSFVANSSQVHNSIGYGKSVKSNCSTVDGKTGRRMTIDQMVDRSVSVPSLDEKEIVYREPSRIWKCGNKQCFKMTLASGQYLEASKDHPVLTPSGYVPILDLKIGDLVASARSVPAPEKVLNISDNEVIAAACLIADGGLTEITPVYSKGDLRLVESFKEAVTHVPGFTGFGREKLRNNAYYVNILGIKEWLIDLEIDCLSKHKRVPAEFFGLKDEQLALFLRWLYTDGTLYIRTPRKIEIGLASEGLIDDIQYLLRRFGIAARKRYKRASVKQSDGSKKWFDSWRLYITDAPSQLLFFDKIGLIPGKEEACEEVRAQAQSTISNPNWDIVPITIEELKEIRRQTGPYKNPEWKAAGGGLAKGSYMGRDKFKRLCKNIGYTGRYRKFAEMDVVWEKIITIEDIGRHDVYDLTVPGTANAVVNGIVIHNTFMASIAICRILYELSCMKDPHRTYGIAADSNISVVGLSVSEELATKVVFENIATKIDASAYFKDHFPYDRTKKEMRFPGHIWMAARATTTNAALGLNVIAALIDEGNFLPKANDPRFEVVDKAEILYNSLKRRLKSRFQELGRLPGAIFIISSKVTSEDFTAKRISDSTNDPHVFVRDYALWEVFPEGTYGDEVFYVLVGNEQTPSKILEGSEIEKFKTAKPEGCVLLEVPEDFRPEFEADLEGSIRDIGGVATVSVSPYIQRREKIDEAVDITREHPYTELVYDASKGGRFKWDHMVRPRLESGGPGGVKIQVDRPILNPDAPRHIHIDAALRNDSLGFSMAHVGGWKNVKRKNADGDVFIERAPVYIVDLVLRVVPPSGDEIILGDIRQLIYDLTHRGYVVTKISMDQWQCLARGTKITTARGIVLIEDVVEGDLVQSRIGFRPVTKTFYFGKCPTKRLSLSNGEVLEGTGRHRIEVLNSEHKWGWKRLADIVVGDAVHVVADRVEAVAVDYPLIGDKSEVAAIEDAEAEVFDLEVAEDPSYVANGVVSHNSADMLQTLSKKGYNVETLSVDRTTDAYDGMKMAMYEGRLQYYRYEPLLKELRELEMHFLGSSSAHRKKRKVDHPQTGCFVGDTVVPLWDFSRVKLSTLVGKEVWVVSSTLDGRVVPGLARGRMTKKVTELLEVRLSNGMTSRCTHSHKWMLKDGSYKEARLLVSNVDILMPIHKAESSCDELKAVSMTPIKLSVPEPVYDLEVDKWSNFAIEAGVFVHNSKDIADALAGACYTLSDQQENLPLPLMGNKEPGDAWMPEQRQALAAGNDWATDNRSVKDYELLPPFLTGNSGGDWGGGWGSGSL